MTTSNLDRVPRYLARVILAGFLLPIAAISSGCDKFYASTGAMLDDSGAVMVFVGECGPPEVIHSVRILEEDDVELWAVHAEAGESLSGPFAIGVDPGGLDGFSVEVKVTHGPGDEPAIYSDFFRMKRLEGDRVYVPWDDYVEPYDYQEWFQRNVCP